MNEQADHYNKLGLQLFCAGQFQEAVDFFTKAIKIDPKSPNAYHNRGRVFLEINRTIEGNADIKMAEELRAEKSNGKKVTPKRKKCKKTANLNWQEVDIIYDTVFPIDGQDTENDILELGDNYCYDVLLDDPIQTEEIWDSLVNTTPETISYPAILEFLNGKKIEVAGVRLFEPTNNDVSIIRKDGHAERLIPLENITCIRMAEIPDKLKKKKNSLCHVEIIETIDGNIYHEAIHSEQDLDNVLFGFSTKEQTCFTYTFIPTVNIRERHQERYLGEILLEKQFIDDDILKHALDEHQKIKSMKLGKIIAQKAKVLHSAIEEELKQAKHDGCKTGEILLSSGLVDEDQVTTALQHQEYFKNLKLGQFLVKKGIIQEKELYMALAEKFRMPFVDLRKQKISRKTIACLPINFILKNAILPLSLDNDILKVATPNPDSSFLRKNIIKECKCKDVQFVLALPIQLRIIFDQLNKNIGNA